MDLQQLQAMGLVTSNPLMKRTINVRYRPLLPADQWSDPQVPERQEGVLEGTVTVYLRKLTAADQIAVGSAINAKRDYVYALLHRSVFNEAGERVFPTEEDAVGIDLGMFSGLIEEINKVNGKPGKKSKPRMNSGVSSPSPSAADQSRNGKSVLPLPSSVPGSDTGPSSAP